VDAYAHGPAPYEFFTVQDLVDHPQAVIGFDGAFEPKQTLLISWTARKVARRAVIQVSHACKIPYLVHFEDNEDHLAQMRLGSEGDEDGDGGDSAADRDIAKQRSLIREAAGATVIEDRLREMLPAELPALWLEPGVDTDLFCAPLAPRRRATLLRGAGVPEGAKVIVYPGNIHRANAQEMAELYRAVRQVRERGPNLVLIKTGKDDVAMADILGYAPEDHGVISVGQVDRPFLIDLLKCADLFVQPGAPGAFNDFRLPSKLPELLAIGRPVILPATNVGLRLHHGVEALLLKEGSAAEIAGHVEAALADPMLAEALSRNARAFARRTYRWDRQGKKLAAFLKQIQRARAKWPDA
jgi:glycosyltransferase involved in cell wall biosynthesis